MKSRMGDAQRLLHILESIEEVEAYTKGVRVDEFLENSMMRFASVKQIEIIGEASNHITDETKKKLNTIQWRQITGMRHVLVHEYFGIDNQIIWQIIHNDLPQLKEAIKTALSNKHI